MKKNIISILTGIAILGGFSASAFAAASSCDTAVPDVKLSANVICKYQNDGASLPQAYGVGTGHPSGTKVYESSNAMGGIYYKDMTGTITSTNVTVPSAGASAPTDGYSEVGK